MLSQIRSVPSRIGSYDAMLVVPLSNPVVLTDQFTVSVPSVRRMMMSPQTSSDDGSVQVQTTSFCSRVVRVRSIVGTSAMTFTTEVPVFVSPPYDAVAFTQIVPVAFAVRFTE